LSEYPTQPAMGYSLVYNFATVQFDYVNMELRKV